MTYRSQASVGLTDDLSGWGDGWTHEYGFFDVPFSTDYGISSAEFTNFGDIWNYQASNAMYDANTQYVTFWSTNIGSDGVAPLAYPWQPSHAYHCNSWIYEFRGGVPVLPNVGDVGTLTISGSFSGSPVTVSHIVTAAGQTALVNLYINNSGAHPITSDLVSKINANTILSTAGVHADDTQNPNRDGVATGGGTPAGSYQYVSNPTVYGRIFIAFNSDGSSVTGGPVIGPITVTGTYTASGTPTSCSIYIQPLTAGRSGFGGPYGYVSTNPGYTFWAMAGLAALQAAGIANASTGRTNLQTCSTTIMRALAARQPTRSVGGRDRAVRG